MKMKAQLVKIYALKIKAVPIETFEALNAYIRKE